MSDLWIFMHPSTEREKQLVEQFDNIRRRDEQLNVIVVLGAVVVGFIVGIVAVL